MGHHLQKTCRVVPFQSAQRLHGWSVCQLNTLQKRHVNELERFRIGSRLQGFILSARSEVQVPDYRRLIRRDVILDPRFYYQPIGQFINVPSGLVQVPQSSGFIRRDAVPNPRVCQQLVGDPGGPTGWHGTSIL